MNLSDTVKPQNFALSPCLQFLTYNTVYGVLVMTIKREAKYSFNVSLLLLFYIPWNLLK
jgi:hypothetical protein